MLPTIRCRARLASRGLDPDARDDLVQEVVDNALVAYLRLVERGKADVAHPRPLAAYALAQFHAGRRVGGRLNARDVSAEHARRRVGLRLERPDGDPGGWAEALTEDRRASPAELAAWRLDFAAWLELLPERTRAIALTLAAGSTTNEAARAHRVTPGRISQLRRSLRDCWDRFQSEDSGTNAASPCRRARPRSPRRDRSTSVSVPARQAVRSEELGGEIDVDLAVRRRERNL
jgi:hypothetical protein